jgi:Flp pilus assembly protein TadG
MRQAGHKVSSASRRRSDDHGAAAVELALVLPLLMFIVFATIDFGRMIAAQITLTQAAREGVRVWALGNGTSTAPTTGDVQTRVTDAAADLSGTGPTATTTACTANTETEVRVSYTFHFVTPIGALAALLPGSPVNSNDVPLNATGVMECER